MEKSRISFGMTKSIANAQSMCVENQFSALERMDKKCAAIPDSDFLHFLLECTSKQDLATGNFVYSLMICNRADAIAVFGDYLIRFFAGCGCLQDAYHVFCKVTKPSVYTWNAIISAHANHGKGEMALTLYYRMQDEGLSPNIHIFSSALKACISLGFLCQGKVVHDQMLRCGIRMDLVSGNALLDMYAKLSAMDAAHKVFTGLIKRDVVSWTTMMTGYLQLDCAFSALQCFEEMQKEGMIPNRVTLLCVVKACGAAGLIVQGRLIHDQIVRSGLELEPTIKNMLVDLYAKCNCLEEAEALFGSMPKRDVVSWGILISGYAQNGRDCLVFECFDKLHSEGIRPNEFIYVCVLKVASKLEALRQGQKIHDSVLTRRLELDTQIGNALVDMYSKCGCMDEAWAVFNRLKCKDEISWGVIISGYTQQGDGFRALELFQKMQFEGAKPNKFILSCALNACGSVGALYQGKLLHCQITISTLESDAVVGNAVVDMYAKCGGLYEARAVFDQLPSRDIVSWGAVITGYTQNGFENLAIDLFEKMQQEGLLANEVILSCFFKACGSVKDTTHGERMFEMIIKSGYDSNLVVANSLIDMYVQCECLLEAQRVFDVLPNRDDVSWGTMVTGYAQCGLHVQALHFHTKMIKEGFKPNKVVFLGVLKACASIGGLRQGKMVHDQIVQAGFDSDININSTLVDMYSKCGSLQDTCEVFDGMEVRDGVTWGVMSAACAHHGKWGQSKQYLEGMQQEGLSVPRILRSSMLSAYSHVGHLREARDLFLSINTEYDIFPSIEHCNGMIDLLGRAGLVEEAKFMLQTMPVLPDFIGWTSLLTACKTYGDMELGRACLNKVNWTYPNMAAGFALMSNIYSDSHLFEEASKVQDLRACLSAWKKPGMAWIDVDNTMYEFCVGDQANSHFETAYGLSKRLLGASKVEGFVLNLEDSAGSEFKPHDVHEQNNLAFHSHETTQSPNLLSVHSWICLVFAITLFLCVRVCLCVCVC